MRQALLALYRVRTAGYYGAAAVLLVNAAIGPLLTQDGVRQIRIAVAFVAVAGLALCVLLGILGPRWLPEPPARVVQPPVRGRWLGMNSPASKVPSHGVRAYGQAYAIDIVAEPVGVPRPSFGGSMMRAAQEYPAFGQPVLAMVDGTVVRASQWRRDHRARSNLLGILYLMVEGMVREIGGPAFVVGNHVTIATEDGAFATVAHLKRGSVTVRVGDHVAAGTRIGSCGNSGNSSEPHVHAQLMDRVSFRTAQGVPMAFADITLDQDEAPTDGLPADQQHMVAGLRA